jgi:signal transduction histidine kinase
LMNAVRHAGASVIRVEVGRAGDSFTITVADDGKGFPSEPKGAGTHAGFGLFSVRERLGHLGGSPAVRSVPGGGTTATIEFPARQEAR